MAWSEETQEAALVHWHPTLGKIHLLTNAFDYTDNGKPLEEPPFERYYKHTFNTSDKLNQAMHERSYPYHRPGWMYNFDNFHFTSLLWNTYVLFLECNPRVQDLSWHDFCVGLYSELWASTQQ